MWGCSTAFWDKKEMSENEKNMAPLNNRPHRHVFDSEIGLCSECEEVRPCIIFILVLSIQINLKKNKK